MSCFSRIKLIPVLIDLKYWYYNSPYLVLFCPPPSQNFCLILLYPTENSIQHNSHHVFHRFPYFVLTYLITCHHKYLIYQIICQANQVYYNLYPDHNNLWVKDVAHQKVESLGADSLSKLDNTVNNNSIQYKFNTKYAEFSTK